MKDALAAKKEELTKAINLIKEKGLPADEEKAEIKKASDDGNAKLQALDNDFQSKINKKQNEINLIEKNIGKYDQKMMDAAKKSEQILADTQKLNDLALQKQKKENDDMIKDLEKKHNDDINALKEYQKKFTDLLVLKYNPVITDKKITNILSSKIDPEWKSAFTLKNYSPLLNQEKVFGQNDFDNLRNKITNYNLLVSRLENIPFTNSVPPALSQIDYLSGSIIQDYENLWNNLAEVIRQKKLLIDSYSYALDSYSKLSRENGFIVDPRDTNKILVYVDKIYNVKPGDVGIVFRNEEETVALIRFYYDADGIKAKISEAYGTNQLQPFDKILIKLK